MPGRANSTTKQDRFGWTDGFHLGASIVVGWLLKEHPVESTTASGGYAAYQFGSRWNKGKQDRIGFDFKVWIIGLVIGRTAKEIHDQVRK